MRNANLPEEWPGDHTPCPHCGRVNTIRLVSVYHCNACAKPFSEYEVELRKRLDAREIEIRRLKAIIKDLEKGIRKCVA